MYIDASKIKIKYTDYLFKQPSFYLDRKGNKHPNSCLDLPFIFYYTPTKYCRIILNLVKKECFIKKGGYEEVLFLVNEKTYKFIAFSEDKTEIIFF